MTSTAQEPIFCLGSIPRGHPSGCRLLSTPKDVNEAFTRWRKALWIADRASSCRLVTTQRRADTWHRILILKKPSAARRETLCALFRDVVAPGNGVRLLPNKELLEVLWSAHPENYLVGLVPNFADRALVFFRGSLERLLVPFDWFKIPGNGMKPDFKDAEIIDGGQTVRLGSYEASVSAILYEFDADARSRMKANLRERDKTFGGALRRLRLARGLSREDFRGISAKTIARLEQGKTRPQRSTLEKIARKLDVAPNDIESY